MVDAVQCNIGVLPLHARDDQAASLQAACTAAVNSTLVGFQLILLSGDRGFVCRRDPIADLPEGLLAAIAAQLSQQDLQSASQVCSEWSRLLGGLVRVLQPSSLSQHLTGRMSAVQSLDLSRVGAQLSNSMFGAVAQLTTLQALDLTGCTRLTSLEPVAELSGGSSALAGLMPKLHTPKSANDGQKGCRIAHAQPVEVSGTRTGCSEQHQEPWQAAQPGLHWLLQAQPVRCCCNWPPS